MANTHCLSYTGEYEDPVTGGYPLGNGYRLYLPFLMRFTAADTESPFGVGGVNPYAYCEGDPINLSDPSGHFAIGEMLGRFFRSESRDFELDVIAGREAANAVKGPSSDASPAGDAWLGLGEAGHGVRPADGGAAVHGEVAQSARGQPSRARPLRELGPVLHPAALESIAQDMVSRSARQLDSLENKMDRAEQLVKKYLPLGTRGDIKSISRELTPPTVQVWREGVAKADEMPMADYLTYADKTISSLLANNHSEYPWKSMKTLDMYRQDIESLQARNSALSDRLLDVKRLVKSRLKLPL